MPDLNDDSIKDWTGDPQPMETHTPDVGVVAKSLTDVAKEVLRGEWGSGQERRIALANAGYDPNQVYAETIRVLNDRP